MTSDVLMFKRINRKNVRDMAMRIPWDKYETAILIDACIQIINNKTDRITAIRNVSAKLRKRAVNSGIMIDDVFRNENGIKMQMTIIMSMIQDEEPGLYNAAKIFYEMVELYRSEYSKFSAILKEANLQIACVIDRKSTFDKLHISDYEVDAVFFHLPQEPYGFLSNWYISKFDLDNIHYSSMEQYIMYQKCILFGDQNTTKKVLLTDDPSEQQKLGRLCTGYINGVWAGARQAIAMRGLLAKFSQNPDLRKQLLNTKNAYLVECAHSDKTWACGIRLNEPERFDATKWTGQNILGFALMEVRRMLNNP